MAFWSVTDSVSGFLGAGTGGGAKAADVAAARRSE